MAHDDSHARERGAPPPRRRSRACVSAIVGHNHHDRYLRPTALLGQPLPSAGAEGGGLRKPHVHGSVYHGSFGRLVPEAMRARAAVARTPVVRLAVVEYLDLGGVPRRDRREEPGAGDRSVGSGLAVEHDQGVRAARARPQELLACDAVAPSPFLLRGFWAMSFKLMAQKPQSRRGEG